MTYTKRIGTRFLRPSIIPLCPRRTQTALRKQKKLIVKSCAKIIEQFNPFGDTDLKGLSNLSASPRSVVEPLQLFCFMADLNSYATVAFVLDKVSPKLQGKWSELTWSRRPHVPTLLELSDFLYNSSMAVHARRIGTVARRSP